MNLLLWRRTVSEMYERVRGANEGAEKAAIGFRRERDALFRTSPQTPLNPDQLVEFSRLEYFPYSQSWRTTGSIVQTEETEIDLPAGDDGVVRARTFGDVHFELAGAHHSLPVYWIAGYGGGVFLPFRDRTSGVSTYGGGRYLFDTIKGAD